VVAKVTVAAKTEMLNRLFKKGQLLDLRPGRTRGPSADHEVQPNTSVPDVSDRSDEKAFGLKLVEPGTDPVVE
jgi:hypothetical protein